MEVRRVEDPTAFLEAAAPLLLADEARHNLMLGIAGTLRDHPSHYPEYALWVAEDGSETVGAALRTPPHHLVVARPRSDSMLAALAAAIEHELPGVVAAQPEAGAFAAAWAARTGAKLRTNRAQGVFSLERVVPPTGGTAMPRPLSPSSPSACSQSGASASSSPTSRTRPRTGSTSRSVIAEFARRLRSP